MTETRTFPVPAISCGHCTRTIESELSGLRGVTAVSADMTTKQVTVSWQSPATWDAIQNLLTGIGFPPAEA